MCQVLGVSRSGYYKWLSRPESEQKKRRKKLVKRIHHLFLDSRRLYGSPKITQQLRAEGICVSQKTVARLMKAHGMISRTVKKYKATTHSNHYLPVHENVLNQRFSAEKPNQVWVADITYVPTQEGWLYVASIMDLFSRKIVGWYADSRMTKELVLTALDRAYKQQKPKNAVLHHSDRGSQYASHEYQKRLVQYRMQPSMSRKGNCFDNACIESFHSILKKELVYLSRFSTRKQAEQNIFEYIEFFYNRKRIHSSIGYVSPAKYERTYLEQHGFAAYHSLFLCVYLLT
jgi:transposase InsO family protein